MDKYKFYDPYLSSNLGKSITLLLKLCGIMQSLKNASVLITRLENKNHVNLSNGILDNEFVKWINSNKEAIKNQHNFIVEKDVVERSIKLITYFTVHKLKLDNKL